MLWCVLVVWLIVGFWCWFGVWVVAVQVAWVLFDSMFLVADFCFSLWWKLCGFVFYRGFWVSLIVLLL